MYNNMPLGIESQFIIILQLWHYHITTWAPQVNYAYGSHARLKILNELKAQTWVDLYFISIEFEQARAELELQLQVFFQSELILSLGLVIFKGAYLIYIVSSWGIAKPT